MSTFGWRYGPSSRCVGAQWPWTLNATTNTSGPVAGPSFTSAAAAATCLPMRCDDRAQLYVDITGTSAVQSVRCPSGATLALAAAVGIRRFQAGAITCPDNAAMCAALAPACTKACYAQGGDCVGGICFCRPGYDGPACNKNLLTGATENANPSNGSFAILTVRPHHMRLDHAHTHAAGLLQREGVGRAECLID